jgi:hypothetical protein
MAKTVPTIKTVSLSNEDTYRKEKMITTLKNRGMLTADSENYIRKGTN